MFNLDVSVLEFIPCVKKENSWDAVWSTQGWIEYAFIMYTWTMLLLIFITLLHLTWSCTLSVFSYRLSTFPYLSISMLLPSIIDCLYYYEFSDRFCYCFPIVYMHLCVINRSCIPRYRPLNAQFDIWFCSSMLTRYITSNQCDPLELIVSM